MRLSRSLQLNPDIIDSSLQRLNCVGLDINEVDIHPTVLSLLTSVAPDYIRQIVSELPSYNNISQSSKEDEMNFNGIGMNTALAFSLHTVLLSRNRLTVTLGLVQFKNTVRLSLLGNRIQRIEDCEALSLLSCLQYLSLEFNPVTSLPHYRAHILRICSWPESISVKNCRLRKLDARNVIPAEVERAALCLQREKVTMGELVHRMRFLALLNESDKRISLHHELRRRGFILQDSIMHLTIESVVTRCSAHLLSLVDVNAASHMARRLMSGKCKLCEINSHNLFTEDISSDNEISRVASSLSQSISSSNIMLLQNPNKSEITTFCKDWSKDVFRRALTSLDHRICELLLNIAHKLGQELTVMDVDHLNKLWFIQISKVDNYNIYQKQNKLYKNNSTIVNIKSSSIPVVKKTSHKEKENKNKNKNLLQEELVSIALSPTDQKLYNEYIENEGVLLRNISPISKRIEEEEEEEEGVENLEMKESRELCLDDLDYSCNEEPHMDLDVKMQQISKINEFQSDRVSTELPQKPPIPFPSIKDQEKVEKEKEKEVEESILEQERIILSNYFRKKCIIRNWRIKLHRKKQEILCTKFIQKRVSYLLNISLPTLHVITSTLELVPRTERKRVLFQFWREQSFFSYTPRLFKLGRLLQKWRLRTFEQQNINILLINQRTRRISKIWNQWYLMFHKRQTLAKDNQINSKNDIKEEYEENNKYNEKDKSNKKVYCIESLSQTSHNFHSTSSPIINTPSKKQYPHISFEVWSNSKAGTEITHGLTCSSKPSMEKTPYFDIRPSLPMQITPINNLSSPPPPPIRLISSQEEKETQTPVLPSQDEILEKYKNAARIEAAETLGVMQADRLRLIDRIITLEQKINEESLRVQHRDEEIRNLRNKVDDMTIREECMKSTLSDYQREIEHLRGVVNALRTERRELLRPIVQ